MSKVITEGLSAEYLKSLGFKVVKDDGQYGEAVDIRANGMTILNWNREGRGVTYFGEKLEPNIGLTIKKDGGTRTAFNGYIFDEKELEYILKRTY